MSKISHNVDSLVHLQNRMQILKSEAGPCAGIHQLSSDDGNQVVGKGKYVNDIKVEEDPGPAASTGIKTEPAVSMCVCAHACACMYVCVHMHVRGCVHACMCVYVLCQVYAPLAT
jgi:hypothetical protein